MFGKFMKSACGGVALCFYVPHFIILYIFKNGWIYRPAGKPTILKPNPRPAP